MSHPPQTPRLHLGYLPAIDGLRAVAVLAVIVYHLDGRVLPGGFVGVDLFFVISGFVVSGAIPACKFTSIWGLLGFFYARRAIRILPALYVCLICTTLLSVLFIPPSWLSGFSEKTGRAAVLGYSNFVLANANDNYFAPSAEYNMFTHTWSLGVEEQFYAVFPWLFLPWLTRKRALSSGLFLLGAVASFVIAYRGARTDQIATFYLIFARFWELALGVLAFQLSTRLAVTGRIVTREVLAAACMGVIVVSLMTAAPDRTPYPASLAPCCATALLLVLISRSGAIGVINWLTRQPMLYIGRISYSLYLWHWPVFASLRWTAGLGTWALDAAALVLTLGSALTSYRWVETPPRRALASGRITPLIALAAAGLLVLLTGPAEQAIWSRRGLLSLSSVARHPRDWYSDADTTLVSSLGCQVRPFVMRQLAVSAIRFERSSCPAPSTHPPALFIVGDSHAGAYLALLANYVLATGAPGIVYYKGGCALLGLKPNSEQVCNDFIAKSIAYVQSQIKPGDVVFLPGLRIPRMVDENKVFGEQVAREKMFGPAEREWRARNLPVTIAVLARLVADGAQVVLEAPKPEFAAPPFRCHDWFNAGNAICAGGSTVPRESIEQLRAPVLAQFRAVVQAVPGVRVWDPLPVLCPGEICSAYDGAMPLYFDGDHVSGYANRKLAPAFQGFVLRAHG